MDKLKYVAFVFAILLIVPSYSFSAAVSNANLVTYLQDFTVSNNVEGKYSSNATNSEYSVSTANTQGDKVFASGSFVSTIYVKDFATAGAYVSSDLDAVTTFTSAGLESSYDVFGK
ncbi:MAG: hypothetical protein B6I36_09630 [Desulfobacteraceae bacterium 4572_35.1]|nr:MAG: hypothetical protein B6I36_09630 [Desulfobacteraceae bacterium 4572_35.1]